MKSARPGPKSPDARDPILEQPKIVAAIAINAFARGTGRVAKERVMPPRRSRTADWAARDQSFPKLSS